MTGVKIEGLDELRRHFREFPKILDRELRNATGGSLRVVRDEAKIRAPGKILPRTIMKITERGGLAGRVFTPVSTAASIERGRKPGDAPSVKNVKAWMQRYGMATGDPRKDTKEAFRIQARIRKRGTKPQPFLTPALPARAGEIEQKFRAAIQRAMAKLAGK